MQVSIFVRRGCKFAAGWQAGRITVIDIVIVVAIVLGGRRVRVDKLGDAKAVN